MSKPVAILEDIQATPGTDTTFGGRADSGAWSADPVSYSVYDKLSVGGSPVIYEATCTFRFVGIKSVGSAVRDVVDSVDLNLSAGGTTLQGGSNGVLVDGDFVEDAYGNRLEVNARGKLSTT